MYTIKIKICDGGLYDGNRWSSKIEINGTGKGRQRKEMFLMGSEEMRIHLKHDITLETPRIRKRCPCEDAEGKHLHRKNNGMKAHWCRRICVVQSVN